jgi:hypothetical protein
MYRFYTPCNLTSLSISQSLQCLPFPQVSPLNPVVLSLHFVPKNKTKYYQGAILKLF